MLTKITGESCPTPIIKSENKMNEKKRVHEKGSLLERHYQHSLAAHKKHPKIYSKPDKIKK